MSFFSKLKSAGSQLFATTDGQSKTANDQLELKFLEKELRELQQKHQKLETSQEKLEEQIEKSSSRWQNPVIIGILAAFVSLISSVFVTYLQGQNDLALPPVYPFSVMSTILLEI